MDRGVKKRREKYSNVTSLFSIGHQQILWNKSDVMLHGVDQHIQDTSSDSWITGIFIDSVHVAL